MDKYSNLDTECQKGQAILDAPFIRQASLAIGQKLDQDPPMTFFTLRSHLKDSENRMDKYHCWCSGLQDGRKKRSWMNLGFSEQRDQPLRD